MTPEAVAAQRCFHHPGRAAVARCLGCLRTYCRECVTEHEDRVLCAACLGAKATAARATSPRASALLRVLSAAFGLASAWVFFYVVGRLLLLVPTAFHKGTLWR